jgi:nucleotide-binding universal stress UspA family protein
MFHRILLPLDGSSTAEKVLATAVGEAKAHDGATIVLLRVIPPLRSSFMVSVKMHEELTSQAVEVARVYLEGIAARLKAEGMKVQTAIESGSPAEVIISYAEENDCDLILIASRGETSSVRWRFGGTASKVVRTSTSMPVMVLTT